MKNFFTKGRIALLVIFSVLIIDQVIKVIVKTHMYWHESIRITDWFYIYFTENNGMAFGLEIFGKLFLTSFRIVAVGVIGWFLYKFIKHGMKTGFKNPVQVHKAWNENRVYCLCLAHPDGCAGQYHRQRILRSAV